jgi:hypothetical protein
MRSFKCISLSVCIRIVDIFFPRNKKFGLGYLFHSFIMFFHANWFPYIGYNFPENRKWGNYARKYEQTSLIFMVEILFLWVENQKC